MEETINNVIREALKHALNRHNYGITIKNLDKIVEKIVPLSERILYKENFDYVIGAVILNFIIRLPRNDNKIYFIEFIFEPHEDSYNYGLSSDSEIFENLLLVGIDLVKYDKYTNISKDEYEVKAKKLIEILEQHGFTKDQYEDEYYVSYIFSLPLDVEIMEIFI